MPNTLPEPITREEKYLAKAAGMTVTDLPEKPLTRVEKYLAAIAEGGGGGGGFTPTQEQLDAMNSGITEERVTQLEGIDDTGDNYIEINGIRLYFSATAPTGEIPDGSVGIGW